MATIQWYPGHMTKTNRQLAESMKMVDIVIEVLDARIPISSNNPDIEKLMTRHQRLIILNKEDLADPKVSQLWKKHYAAKDAETVFTNSKTGTGMSTIKDTLKKIGQTKVERHAAKGVVNRAVRAMIVGVPNSGKSSLINRLAGKATAKTGDRPGVTRAKQWVRLDGGIDLLDTPGILWPKFENETVALNLAFTGAIKDEITDTTEIAEKLLRVLLATYPQLVEKRYGIQQTALPDVLDFSLLKAVGKKRGFLISGGEIDYSRAAAVILDEFRAAKIGRISLEKPQNELVSKL